jgi:hypothetical protein
MGAHGTLDEALQGVSKYMAPSSEDEELVERRRQAKKEKKARKHEEGDRSKRKRAHKHGDREHKKEKKAKRHVKDAADAEDESDAEGDVQQQLERGRAAVRITRAVLERQPALKQELRQVHPSLRCIRESALCKKHT